MNSLARALKLYDEANVIFEEISEDTYQIVKDEYFSYGSDLYTSHDQVLNELSGSSKVLVTFGDGNLRFKNYTSEVYR